MAFSNTFADETGRQAHIGGAIARALFAQAGELLAQAPTVDQPEILAVKTAANPALLPA